MLLPLILLYLILIPENKTKAGIGAVKKCTHKKCGICGGIKRKSKIGTLLSEVCSSKCQAATKDACECKCNGKFHQGQNSKILNKILNPELQAKEKTKAVKKAATLQGKKLINSFVPITVKDYLAMFIYGTRFNTASFYRHADKNLISGSTIALNWLSPKGVNIDTMAKSFVDNYYFNLDEQEATQEIVNFIIENPDGVAKYIQRSTADRAQMENVPFNYIPSFDKNPYNIPELPDEFKPPANPIIFGHRK